MAAKNKAKYEVQVDIDVETGEVNTGKLLADVTKDVKNKLQGLKPSKVDAPIVFDTKKLFGELDSIAAAAQKRISRQQSSLRNVKRVKAKNAPQGLKGESSAIALRNVKVQKDLRRAIEAATKEAVEGAKLKEAAEKKVQEAYAKSTRLAEEADKKQQASLRKLSVSALKAKLEYIELGKTMSSSFSQALGSSSKLTQQQKTFITTLIAQKEATLVAIREEITARRKLLAIRKEEGKAAALGLSKLSSLKDEIALNQSLERIMARRIRQGKQVPLSVAQAKERLANLRSEIALTKILANRKRASTKGVSEGISKLSDLAKEIALEKIRDKARAQRAKKGKPVFKANEAEARALKALDASIKQVTSSYEKLAAAESKTRTSKNTGTSAEIVGALNGERAAVLGTIASLERQVIATKAANQSTADLEKRIRKLSVTAKKLERELRGPTKTMLEFANSFKTFIRFAIAFRVLGGISRAFGTLAENVTGLDDALTSIKAITRATTEEMIAVENAVKNVATTTQFTTEEIAASAQVLAQAGTGPSEIAATLSATANFAAATNASLTVAADIMSTLKNVYKDLDPEEISNKLTNAVNTSKLTATGLQTIFSRLAQTAKSFNLNLDQVLGAAATLKNVGIKDSTISTGFRQGLLELLSPDAKTLKVLQARYESIGETLSKQAISSLFSGFKGSNNPLLSVLNELEKLGIQGSGAEDFERVFDVRATNVIKALVANKEQFVKNTEAIGRTGSAAAGAKTQLESLEKSASNLVATVSVLASDLSGPLIDRLKGVVDWGTQAANSLRDVFLAQKGVTGSSGVGASLELGAAAGAVTAAKGFGAPKAILTGIITSSVAGAINAFSGKGQGVTEGVTKTIATLLEVVTTLSVFKALFPGKALGDVVTSGASLTKKVPLLKKALSSSMAFLSAGLSKTSVVIGLSIAAVSAIASTLSSLFDSSLEDTLERISAKRDVLSKKLQDQKAETAKASKKVEDALGRQLSSAGFRRARESVDAKIKPVVDSLPNELKGQAEGLQQAVTDIFAKRATGVKDAGSEAFDSILSGITQELEGLGVTGLGKSATASLLSGLSTEIAEAEGRRLQFTERLKEALADSSLASNQEFLKEWDALTQEERNQYRRKIDTVKEARKLTALIGGTDYSAEVLQAVAEKEKAERAAEKTQRELIDNTREAIEAAKKASERGGFEASLDEAIKNLSNPSTSLIPTLLEAGLLLKDGKFILVEKAKESLKKSGKVAEEEVNKALSELTVAIEKGAVSHAQDFVDLLVSQQELSLEAAKEAIESAKKNAEALAKKALQDRINKLDLSSTTKKVSTPLGETTTAEVDFSVIGKDKENLAIEADIKEALRKVLVLQQEALGDAEKVKDLKQQSVVLESLLKDVRARILDSSFDEEEAVKNLATLKRGFIVDEAKVADINRRLASAKSAELRDEEAVSALLAERLQLEKGMLSKQKQALENTIKSFLAEKGVSTDPTASLSEIIGRVNKSGLLVKEGFEGLAPLISEAIQVQTSLNSAEETYTKELDNYLRQDLTKQLGEAEGNLTKQHSKTEKLESQLGQASDKLKSAREKLAEVYDKEAEDTTFFRDLDRQIRGEEAQQKGDAKELNKQARKAGTAGESVSLAKEAGSLAASLLSEGKITRREAEKISKESKSIVAKARAEEKAEARAEIDRRKREFAELSKQHAESLSSEVALQSSVDKLRLAIESLPAKILATTSQAQSSSRAPASSSTVTTTSLTPGKAKKVRASAAKEEALRVAAAQIKAAEEAKKKLKEGGSAVGEAGGSLSSSADRLDSAAKALSGAAGQFSTSYISDLGKNTGVVAEGDRFRSETGQQNIISAYDKGELSQASAEKLLTDLKQSLNPSVITGFSVGGLIEGPGSGTSDTAGNFALSNREYVHPAKATDHYGVDFMEQIRSLKFSAAQVRAVTTGDYADAPYETAPGVTSGADAIAGAFKDSSSSNLRPVTLNVGEAKFSSQASDRSISSFRDSLSMQALKVGTK